MAYVYAHQRKDNGRCFYIGKGKGDRAFDTQKRNEHWKRVVNKYGFNTVILVDNISDEKALELEKSFIEQIGLENLTNMQEGGQGGWNHLDKDAIQKRSKTLSEKKKGDKSSTVHMQTKEAKLNRAKALSKAKKGKRPAAYGSHLTEEAIQKASLSKCKYLYIDNKGNKGTAREIRKLYPGIDVHKHSKNGPIKKGKYKGIEIKRIEK